jgi:hypothetical protein
VVGPFRGNSAVRDIVVRDMTEYKAAVSGKTQARIHQISATWSPVSAADGVYALSVHTVGALGYGDLPSMLRAGKVTRSFSVSKSDQSGGITEWAATGAIDSTIRVYTSTNTSVDLYMIRGVVTYSARGSGNFT